MKLLLDTHALIWWFENPKLLGSQALETLSRPESEVWVSAVSAFEMRNKRRIGKLHGIDKLIDGLAAFVADQGFSVLQISLTHAELGGSLPIPHRDPFDRLLIAQSQIEGAWLVSNEKLFDEFGVRRLW